MPTRPPHPCPACNTPTTGRGKCPTCRSATEQARGSAASRGYDTTWRKLRAAHLATHPLCTDCGKLGTEVDHIVPVSDAPHRRLDPTNLRTYCKPHHSARTWRDQGPGAHPRT